MAGRNIINCYILICILFIDIVDNSKLNVPRILLPLFNELSINFTLDVTDGGCYQWSSSRSDLIQLTPIYLDDERGCSASVIVSTIATKEAVRNTAMILAQEIQTEQILRCDVILDVIHKLEIITTTRELYMEEAPEAFEARAYDDQGNEFSSLQGVPFDWNLQIECPVKGKCTGNQVIRFLTFKESPYETPSTIQMLEDVGIRGHIVLLEGVKTGVVKISAKLPQIEYKHLETSEVTLTVVANLIILPPEVYILPNAEIKFKVFRMQQNKLDEIEMPNKQYYLSVEHSDIAQIQNDGVVTGQTIGKTRILVNDNNVDSSDTSVKLPSASVSVVLPAYLTINILPHRNWAILQHDIHEIVVEAFSSQDHKIVLSDSVECSIQIDTKYFQIIKRSSNGTWLSGYGLEPGFTPVHAALESVNKQILEPRVSVRTDLFIYSRIALTPAEIILPWDPVTRPKYEMRLKATGGDNHFLWSTTNAGVAVVTQSGIVRTQTQGVVDISAAMARNHHNRKTCKVHILPPIRLEIVEFILEAETGKPINLQVALYAKRLTKSHDEVPFTQCDEIPFKVISSDENFFYNQTRTTQPVGTACTTIPIVSHVVGTSKITISYDFQGTVLEDSVTVSTYQPLMLLQPKKAETVLAVGTSRKLILQGGPRPLIGRPNEHKRTITSSAPSVVEAIDIETVTNQDVYVVQVRCLNLGESYVDYSVLNTPVVTSVFINPAVVSIHVICSRPRSIRIKPNVDIVDTHSCPMDLNSQKMALQNHQHIEMSVILKDEHGRIFDNITSLQLNWKLIPTNLGTVLYGDDIIEDQQKEFDVFLPKRTYQVLIPNKLNGNLEVHLIVRGYKHNFLIKQGINPDTPHLQDLLGCGDNCPSPMPVIFTAITFLLVGDVEVSTNSITVYNHPSNVQFVDLKQGSGYYEIALSSKDIASIKYNEANRELEITPKATGELKISVTDICLPSRPTPIQVQVVSVKSIKVEMADKVEIGKCIKIIVKLYDDSDVLLPLPELELLELHSNIDVNIVSIKLHPSCTVACLSPDDKWDLGEVHYILTGIELGETKITFSTGQGPRKVISTPIVVQVFRPMKVLPRNVTLIVSSVLQLSHEGGPSPDANIEFTADSSNVALLHTNGLIEAKSIGSTKVRAQAVGINSCSGNKVLYSKDSVQINVVRLTGVKIGAPLTRFKVGNTIPVWVLGIPEEITPLILGTTTLPIIYEWQVIPEDLAKICSGIGCKAIKYNNTEFVSAHITGLRAGRGKIMLQVTTDPAITSTNRKLKATLDIVVYEPLIVEQQFQNQEILLGPHSSFQIQSNKDRIGHVAYSVQYDMSDTAALGPGGDTIKQVGFVNTVVTVSDTGLIRSYGMYGRAVVVVTAMEEFGLKQTVAVVVQVKPIHYLLMNVETVVHLARERTFNAIPRGIQLQLKITYHDNTGDVFHSVENDLRIRTSRFDLLTVQRNNNVSLYALAHKSGDTVLKVWDKSFAMHVVDYVKFHVDDIIKPSSPLVTAGDVICFTSPLVSPAGDSGKWSSTTPFVQTETSEDGIMIAVKSRDRPVVISYTVSNDVQVITDVQVLPIQNIKFVAHESMPPRISNSFRLSVEEIPLVLLSDIDLPDKDNNLIASSKCKHLVDSDLSMYPFSCDIEFTNRSTDIDIMEIFKVEPAFNFKTGQYTCKITTIRDCDLNTSMLTNNITLTVTAAGGVKNQIDLTFVPGVFIDNSELYVSEEHPYSFITIHGLANVLSKVRVSPIDSDYIDITLSPSHTSQTSHRYNIHIKNYVKQPEIDSKIGIFVISSMTKQEIKIDILANADKFQMVLDKPEWGSPLMEMLWDFRQAFAISASVVGVLLASIYGYSNFIQPIIQVNIQQQRPMIVDCSPNSSKQQSFNNTGFSGRFNSSSPSRYTSCYGAPSSPRRTMLSNPFTTSSSPDTSQNYSPTNLPPSYQDIRQRAFK